MSWSGCSATSGSRLFISIRSAASWTHPLQLRVVPCGARMTGGVVVDMGGNLAVATAPPNPLATSSPPDPLPSFEGRGSRSERLPLSPNGERGLGGEGGTGRGRVKRTKGPEFTRSPLSYFPTVQLSTCLPVHCPSRTRSIRRRSV